MHGDVPVTNDGEQEEFAPSGDVVVTSPDEEATRMMIFMTILNG